MSFSMLSSPLPWYCLFCRWICVSALVMIGWQPTIAQQALLINFGSASCADQNSPSVAIIKNPLSTAPLVLAQCNLQTQLPNFYSVFVAYNPKDNKVYLCDIRNGDSSHIWPMNIGLPAAIVCPPSIPNKPVFSYPYVSNNFEFDNNGNLWSIAAYNPATGTARMDKFDVETGAVLSSKLLAFPVGNAPSTIFTGDITILPNGRMYAVLGNPSKLYEIIDYQTGSHPATAIFLQSIPVTSFAIAYLNGLLQISGTNLVNQCHAYLYSIANNTLSSMMPFQNNQAPLDNTSITPALGAAKQIVSTKLIDGNTAEIAYEIFVRNLGNVVLNDVNVTDDLGQAFGAANVNLLSVKFNIGDNAAGLLLDPNFNGTTHTKLLMPNQQLANQTASNADYFLRCTLTVQVSNVQMGTVYYNSAVALATINNDIDKILVADSSNNGDASMVDPNRDGNAGGEGENKPTPFSIGALALNGLQCKAIRKNKEVLLQWSISDALENGTRFLPAYSLDGMHWNTLNPMAPSNMQQKTFEQWHHAAPAGKVYYRILQQLANGKKVYSNVAAIAAIDQHGWYQVYPNPTAGAVQIIGIPNTPIAIDMIDYSGRVLRSIQSKEGTCQLPTEGLASGVYFLRIQQRQQVGWQRLTVL